MTSLTVVLDGGFFSEGFFGTYALQASFAPGTACCREITAEVVSYVSAKNTGVRSAQFVIKTAAIEKADAPTDTPDRPETLTFWQKLLRLCGLY